MTGVGIAGVAGTTHVASSVRATAITAGAGIGGGAVSPGRSARKGICAGAAPVAASVLGLASALGLASGTIAAAVRRGVGARDTDGVSAGPLATGCSTHACCNGSATGVTAGSAAVTCAGTTTTRRSGASIRRSCQGKPKPGSQSPWPPKVRLNSNVWISSESSSACVSRLCSGLMRWLSARSRGQSRVGLEFPKVESDPAFSTSCENEPFFRPCRLTMPCGRCDVMGSGKQAAARRVLRITESKGVCARCVRHSRPAS